MANNKKLALIDDDEKMSSVLIEYLSKFKYAVTYFSNPVEGLKSLNTLNVDIVILDIMMPEKGGLEVCRELRKYSSVPIIFLSARGDTMDRIIGLELGADDYLPKPFEPRELVARIESVLRRRTENQNRPTNGLYIVPDTMQAFLNDKNIELTTTEFQALHFLMQNCKKIVSRDELLTFLQGIDSESYGRGIDVLISRIRQKLDDNVKVPKFILTVRNRGYRFIGEDN